MVFSSAAFLFGFLPVVWLVNRFLPVRVSNWFLCIASLGFYAWGEPMYVLLMILSAAINYFFARGMATSRKKKLRLAWSVGLNLGILFLFKYADFTVDTINLLPGVAIGAPNILLPIGISFFTFQAMSYTIDVYRGVTPAQPSFMKLLLYIAFFPQLIAGPIVKYHDIAAQIDSRNLTAPKTAQGIRRFTLGLSKKLLIANTLGATVDALYAMDSAALPLPVAWLAALCYIMQLYYDFSGYSDMAIGLGHMFGFDFKENFNYPYIATSVQEFWRRWHISLSTWFKEYLYIPLGGNRRGAWRTAFNRVAVFFLTGLWHGAQWTFVGWGLIHGLFLLLEQYGVVPVKKLGGKARWVGHAYTLLVVTLAFVLFRSESFGQALGMWQSMFSGPVDPGALWRFFTPMTLATLALAAVGSTPWIKKLESRLSGRWQAVGNAAGYAVALGLLALCMLSLAASTHNPFIYFRF